MCNSCSPSKEIHGQSLRHVSLKIKKSLKVRLGVCDGMGKEVSQLACKEMDLAFNFIKIYLMESYKFKK